MMRIWCVVFVLNLLFNFGSTKPAELINANLSVPGQEITDATSYGSMVDSVKSSIYDATSKASNLMEYTRLINDSPFMSLAEKAQFLKELILLSPKQLGMISDLFGMLGDVITSHLQWKLKVIRAAKGQLDLAIQALENGDFDAAKTYAYNALYTLPKMCPIYHALKYALSTGDFNLMSFVGKLGQLILSRMEGTALDVSLPA